MFKKLILPVLLAAAIFTPYTYADVSGSVGVSSDYFYRGVSQNDGNTALDLGLSWTGDGFYAGAWGSQVDFGNEVDYEYDFFAGYALAVTDKMNINVGLIQYNYDSLIEETEEVFAKVDFGNVSFAHSVNLDNSDLTFTQVEYQLPFITQVDVSVIAAMHSDESAAAMGAGDNQKYVGVSLTKDLGKNFSISAMIMDSARHGDMMDNASIGLRYNF